VRSPSDGYHKSMEFLHAHLCINSTVLVVPWLARGDHKLVLVLCYSTTNYSRGFVCYFQPGVWFPRHSLYGRGVPWVIARHPIPSAGCRVLQRWETPITRHPWAFPRFLLPSNISGRMISRGNRFPRLSPLRPATDMSSICYTYTCF